MIDIRWLRDNPQAFDAGLARRGAASAASTLLDLDARKRASETELQEVQARRNELSREVGQRFRGKPPQAMVDELASLKERLRTGEEALRVASARLDSELATLPNMPAADVPDGRDEAQNVEIHRRGEPRSRNFRPLAHDVLGLALGMDFERAAKLSGSRFVTLRGQLARLERALGQFMLDLQTGEHGYTEVSPPLLVRDAAVFGTGQLPKFAEDLFRTTTDHWLIPTAEVPLTNMVAGEILSASQLPLRFTALTPCFRSEAGAAGKDTRGMIRQHQFAKVELVSITTPEDSAAEHERMTTCAEAVLERLELPFRRMLLCTGDMGFAAARTYDLEVWLPGQGAYREISSCSNCTDFQARRMAARFRADGDKGTRFVHTLNGSGVAVGRALIAVLENYQEADGSVTVPAALVPYMGGVERLAPQG